MELVLVSLTAPPRPASTPASAAANPTTVRAAAYATGAGPTAVGPQVLSDILWANARPDDRVEHISVHAGADRQSYTAGLFLLPTTSDPGPDACAGTALRLCRTAIANSPALVGWHAHRLITDHHRHEVP
ncbi:hypothetical protein ACFW1A_32095 [Kitasatospora sp. NPDC058965]|uniref:hypothetical protein n=1 Tax=Kitasatospora sp. NPDC058965 TaxID=3346682 RepID=UPI0036A1BC5F